MEVKPSSVSCCKGDESANSSPFFLHSRESRARVMATCASPGLGDCGNPFCVRTGLFSGCAGVRVCSVPVSVFEVKVGCLLYQAVLQAQEHSNSVRLTSEADFSA
jgi:hypothetical protein